jgi:hypothetical protein
MSLRNERTLGGTHGLDYHGRCPVPAAQVTLGDGSRRQCLSAGRTGANRELAVTDGGAQACGTGQDEYRSGKAAVGCRTVDGWTRRMAVLGLMQCGRSFATPAETPASPTSILIIYHIIRFFPLKLTEALLWIAANIRS